MYTFDHAFEGSDLDQGLAGRLATEMDREKILYQQPIGGGKYQFAARMSVTDDSVIEELKDQMRKKTTIELVEQGEISEAITLTGALKARFHLECASASDLKSKANRLRNLESSLGNKLMAIMTFARDDKESVAIGKMIDELLKDDSYHITFIDASITPLGNDLLEQYANAMANATYDSQLLGTMLININVHDLQTCWPAFKEDSQERFYLLDDENNVVFSNLTEEIGGKFFQDGLEDGISSCRIDGKLYDTIVSGSKSLGWKSVKMIPRSQLDQEITVVPYMTLLLMLILTVLAVLVSIFISKIFTRPLQELYVKLQRFEAEKSGIPLPENQVEINGLSRSYQHMINEINALTIKNYETQIQLRRAELMALQSQINPHFIYNTLNSIKWMADMQGSKRMVTALDSLIKLMQFSSKNSREVIRIQDEIDLIRDYINLINLKYFDRIFVDVHVEPGLENYETLKFLLQPIVENSIYHGFSSMIRQCTVQINITRKEDRILYEVIDNGKGMSKEKIRQALEEDHPLNSHSFNKIGLYNVNKRIQYIFGEEYGIQIDSEPGKYTRVIVEIPARIYKEEMANA